MEMTTAEIIEVHNVAVEEVEEVSEPILLSKNINTAIPENSQVLGTVLTLPDSVSENNCIVKVYNAENVNTTGEGMSSELETVLISTGIGPSTSGAAHSTHTRSIVKVFKPQNVCVPANENNSNLDRVYTETVGVMDTQIDSNVRSRNHSTVYNKLLQENDKRNSDIQADDKVSKGNSQKKSPVIMFKWGSAKKPFRCQICDMSFTDGNLLRTHLEKHNSSRKEPSKPFPCNLCTKSFQSNRSLERHQFIHSGQSQKRCKYCYKVFANKENLDKHVKMHVANKAYICEFCSAQFTSRTCLENHIPTHSKEKNFICHICAKKFNRKDILERHLLTHGVGKRNKHECVECSKSFSYLYALKRHVRSVHAGEPDGKACEVCGKFIKNRENIARHMQLHEGKRPYGCPKCERLFTQKQHLVDHMVTHTEALPFDCKFCGLLFRYRRSLSRHLQKHYIVHAKTKLECVECHLMFSNESELIQHTEKAHFNIRQCLVCKEDFAHARACMKHMLMAHDMVNKATETDPTAHESNTDPALCNTVTASPVCNTVTETHDNDEKYGEEVTTAVESENHQHKYEYTNEEIKGFNHGEHVQRNANVEVSDGQEVMYILYENEQGLCEIQKMDVDQVIEQTGVPVIESLQGKEHRYALDMNQVIQVAESETKSDSNELDTENNSNIVQVITAVENKGEETGNIEIGGNCSNLCQTYVITGTNGEGISSECTEIVPEGEKEDGSMMFETEESKFVAERSKLLQSLIDYAEKIQEEELTMTSNEASGTSETKI